MVQIMNARITGIDASHAAMSPQPGRVPALVEHALASVSSPQQANAI
jgi:hypothetical protein